MDGGATYELLDASDIYISPLLSRSWVLRHDGVEQALAICHLELQQAPGREVLGGLFASEQLTQNEAGK